MTMITRIHHMLRSKDRWAHWKVQDRYLSLDLEGPSWKTLWCLLVCSYICSWSRLKENFQRLRRRKVKCLHLENKIIAMVRGWQRGDRDPVSRTNFNKIHASRFESVGETSGKRNFHDQTQIIHESRIPREINHGHMHSGIHESRFLLSNFHASRSSFSPYHASRINPLPTLLLKWVVSIFIPFFSCTWGWRAETDPS